MKKLSYTKRLIINIWGVFNQPEIAILLFILPVGFFTSLVYHYEFQDYYYPFKVVRVAAYDENHLSLKNHLYLEIQDELRKHNLDSMIMIDSTSNEITVSPIDGEGGLTNMCIHIANQALSNLKKKHHLNHCISGFTSVSQ